ncbi:hypothetical protein [Hyphomonas sp.]|uniref:hypothetical protein n=1 Tax=Hyphomonas sp. TaxID=87 RepID=UPI0032967F69
MEPEPKPVSRDKEQLDLFWQRLKKWDEICSSRSPFELLPDRYLQKCREAL